MAHPNRLQNTNVLVLGGTSGIGFAVANMALSNGANVIISGSRQAKVDDKVQLLRSYYPRQDVNISGHALDLSLQGDALEANLKALLEKVTHGGEKPLDHIVFTAGDALPLKPIPETKVDEIPAYFHMRFAAPLLLAKLILQSPARYIRPSHTSSLTLTGGINTYKPLPGWALVAGVGGAVAALARGLAVDLKPVRVNIVEPGAVETELFAGVTEEQKRYFAEKTLVGRVGSPGDVAESYGGCMRDWFMTARRVGTDGGAMGV